MMLTSIKPDRVVSLALKRNWMRYLASSSSSSSSSAGSGSASGSSGGNSSAAQWSMGQHSSTPTPSQWTLDSPSTTTTTTNTTTFATPSSFTSSFKQYQQLHTLTHPPQHVQSQSQHYYIVGSDQHPSSVTTAATTEITVTTTATACAPAPAPAAVVVRPVESVYVHPLSQIVLWYMQQSCHDWILKHGLDRNLTIHRDGTFVIEFPSPMTISSKPAGAQEPAFYPQQQQQQQKEDANASALSQSLEGETGETATTSHGATRITSTTVPVKKQKTVPSPNPPARIFTYYDRIEKKHWLAFQTHILNNNNNNSHREPFQLRFLLQDNQTPTWKASCGNTMTRLPVGLSERIQASVDKLLAAIDETLQEQERARFASSTTHPRHPL